MVEVKSMLTRREMLGATAASSLIAGPAFTAAAPGDLGAIRAVTITSGDLALAEQAWTRFMDYRVVDRGRIPSHLADSWGAPGVAGRHYVALGPASGEPTVLRFVDQPTPAGYSPLGALGWSTTEITVRNSDQLFERLRHSPFKILHPPHIIPTYPYLKAMQAEGPSGERLNLTWINPAQPGIAVAKSFVGRCFIAVQGTPDLAGALRYFHETFGAEVSPIRVVPEVPKIELAVVDLADGCKIETDQYRPSARPKPRPGGGLPPGLALVSFECPAFARMASRALTPPVRAAVAPLHGRRAATMIGFSGELIELIEV
jgi:hypothetical protein